MNLSICQFQRTGFNRFILYYEGLNNENYSHVGAALLQSDKDRQTFQDLLFLNQNYVSYELVESISMQDGGAIATIKAQYETFYQYEQYWLGGRSQQTENMRVMIQMGYPGFTTWNNSIFGSTIDTRFDMYITSFALKVGNKFDIVVMGVNPNLLTKILYQKLVYEVQFGESYSNQLGQTAFSFWIKLEEFSTPEFICLWVDSSIDSIKVLSLAADGSRTPGIASLRISNSGEVAIVFTEYRQVQIKTRFRLFYCQKPSTTTNQWNKDIIDLEGAPILRDLSFRINGDISIGIIDGNTTKLFVYSNNSEMRYTYSTGSSSRPEFYSVFHCLSGYSLLIGVEYINVDPLDTNAKMLILNPEGSLYSTYIYNAGANETFYFGHSFGNSVVLFGHKKISDQKYYSVVRKVSFDQDLDRIIGDYDGISYLKPVRPIIEYNLKLEKRYSDIISYSNQNYMGADLLVETIRGVMINVSLFPVNTSNGIGLYNFDFNEERSIVIENVEITGLRSDSTNSSAIFLHRYVSVINSVYLHDNQGSGIIVFAGMHFTIKNSTIERNQYGIKVSRTGNEQARHRIEQCKITYNYIHGIYFTKEFFKDNYGEWGGVNDVDIYYNEVSYNSGWGLVLEKGQRNKIENNKFCYNTLGGISYSPFSDNSIKDNECGEFTLKGLYYVDPIFVSLIIGLIVAAMVIPIVVKKLKSRSKVPKSIKNKTAIATKSEDSDFEMELD